METRAVKAETGKEELYRRLAQTRILALQLHDPVTSERLQALVADLKPTACSHGSARCRCTPDDVGGPYGRRPEGTEAQAR
jgi:hypothetical protein